MVPILVRGPQRNRTNRTGGKIETEAVIDYKKLVDAVMEADQSQDLQGGLASWRPRRGNGTVAARRLADWKPGKS